VKVLAVLHSLVERLPVKRREARIEQRQRELDEKLVTLRQLIDDTVERRRDR
jgi:hypothetical protein